MQNRSVPTSTLLPHISYRDVASACEWLTQVFGFIEHYRYGEPVSGIQMRIGEVYIMLHGPRPNSQPPATLGFSTQMLTVFVADVDAHYARAREQSAAIWEEPHETIYGERQYCASDLDGHRWLFSQHARDVSPQDWGATIATPYR